MGTAATIPPEAEQAARALRTRGPRRGARGLLDDARAALAARTARVNERPVVILGNQKSGTSAVAALLSVMTDETLTLDLRRDQSRDPAFLRRLLGEITIHEFVERNRLDFSRAIVKEPNLTLLYADVAERFPSGKFVFVVRDPRDNVRSILDWVGLPGDLDALDPSSTRDLTTVQRSVLDATWLGIAPPGTHYVEQLARRWALFADVYLEHRQAIVLQRYEDFVADKEGSTRALAEHVGLRPVHQIARFAGRHYQPPGANRGKTWEEFFGEVNLRRILSVCLSRMNQLGYDERS